MSDLRSLIEAAKSDGPSAAARAKVWSGVSTAIGGAAASGAAMAGSASAAKMLLLGTLMGGALTVGIGGALLFAGPPPHLPGARTQAAARAPEPAVTIWRSTTAQSSGGGIGSTSNQMPGTSPTASSILVPSSGARRSAAVLPARVAQGHAPSATAQLPDGALAREAALLAAARGALARRDAVSALQMVRKLRALPAGQLIPEELAVETQALRALGLDNDADQVEATLRNRFPDSVLGR
jgi:hypothetical protein